MRSDARLLLALGAVALGCGAAASTPPPPRLVAAPTVSASATHDPSPNPDAELQDHTLAVTSFARNDRERAACLSWITAPPEGAESNTPSLVRQAAQLCAAGAPQACSILSMAGAGQPRDTNSTRCHLQLLVTACEGPDVAACLALGALTEQRAPELARKLYGDACRRRNALGCALEGAIAPPEARAPKLRLPAETCSGREAATSCRRVAESELQAAPRRYRLRGEALLQAACHGGDPEACLIRARRELQARQRLRAPIDAGLFDSTCRMHGTFCASRADSSLDPKHLELRRLDAKAATLVLESACRAGREGGACLAGGLAREIPSETGTSAPARPLYRAGCELGVGASCALDASFEAPGPRRSELLARACGDAGDASCVHWAGRTVGADLRRRSPLVAVLATQPRRLEALLRAACEHGSTIACVWLADPERGLVSGAEVARLLRRVCSNEQRSVDGCALRARWGAQYGDRDTARWRDYACEAGHAQSCFERAASLRDQPGGERRWLQALELACKRGSPAGCFVLADAMEATDAARALELRAQGAALQLGGGSFPDWN